MYMDMLNHFVFVYLDDILIFSKTLKEHTWHMRTVLQRLLENSLFVKAKKCECHLSSVTFLGYIIVQGSIQMNPGKVSAVLDWPAPDSWQKLQRFLGFANFYCRFFRNYSSVATPLTNLTSTKRHFAWASEADAAFRTLKQRLTSAPILCLPDPAGRGGGRHIRHRSRGCPLSESHF